MKMMINMFLGVFLISMMLSGAAQEEKIPIVSLMIDVDAPANPNKDEVRASEVDLYALYTEIRKREESATIFLTQDVTASRIRLILAQFSVLSNFEFAVSGNHSDDLMSTMSLEEQEAMLRKSIEVAKMSKICGLSEIILRGFMPPSFDQNEDTYRAMDAVGIEYNAGFQAGLIYAPGHENDVWPYRVDGYNFFAVPVSTHEVSGKKMPLYDREMKENGISASEWYGILASKFDQSSARDEPTVILLSTSISGEGEYLDALAKFLDYAASKNATTANSMDLVRKSKTGSFIATETEAAECPTCGQDEGIDLSITLVEAGNSTNSSNSSGQVADA